MATEIEIIDAERKRTVLVVEDNEMNREILSALLADDYTVLEAENGLVGLNLLEEHRDSISLIMLDVYMPECDGFEFLERKRQDPLFEPIPVIMMTASNTVDDEIRCLELGANDFITKPYNAEVMKNRMKSIIRMRESSAMLSRVEKDRLTGLLSMEFFYLNAGRYLNAHTDEQFDLVCSDVQGFRTMNDRYGRTYCDRFLRFLAGELQGRLPDLVMGGRIGSDVFAFLLRHQTAGGWTDALLTNNENLEHGRFTIKYGIYENLDPTLPVASMCDRATLAMSRIKQRFDENISWYDDVMRQIQLREHQIADNMQSALEERQFVIYYQPKHDLHRDRTGGAEALVRWTHPQLGFISPGLFIPIFERNGFITKLDFYIWEEVCREMQRCVWEGIPIVPVSINVSRLDFEVPDLAEQIAALADRYGIDHAMLHIEVTESMYSENPNQIAQTLERLHENGFFIELDDFGSGYSSLTSLDTLRLDVMKLDMSMVRHAAATGNYSIMRFATLLADGMRMKTVVEGVETDDQVAAMKVLGCDYIQGYYYSKPLPANEFEAYLREHA